MTGPADSDSDDVSSSAQRAATTGAAPNPYALPLSASELRELEQGLGSFGLHRVLGMFCAVASVPRKVPERIWLEELLEDASFSDEASFRSLAERLIPLAEHVSERIGEGEIEPLLPEAADAESCAAWAKGYASILRHIDPSGLSDEVIEAAFAIQALAGEPATLELVDSLRGERSRAEFLAEQRERLADDAGFLHESWADEPKLPLVSTIRRSEPKVGRNDPCPCGSGKKYKKCCAP